MQPSEPAARFTLPICPSVNNLFINASTGRVRGAPYKRWCRDAGWSLREQGVVPVAGIVAMLIEAPLHRRRDVDNAIKPVLDLLVRLGVLVDDNLVDDLRITRRGTGDLMTVSIWRIGDGGEG